MNLCYILQLLTLFNSTFFWGGGGGGEFDLVQSDLGYPATSGPEHIRISDLAGYERYA